MVYNHFNILVLGYSKVHPRYLTRKHLHPGRMPLPPLCRCLRPNHSFRPPLHHPRRTPAPEQDTTPSFHPTPQQDSSPSPPSPAGLLSLPHLPPPAGPWPPSSPPYSPPPSRTLGPQQDAPPSLQPRSPKTAPRPSAHLTAADVPRPMLSSGSGFFLLARSFQGPCTRWL